MRVVGLEVGEEEVDDDFFLREMIFSMLPLVIWQDWLNDKVTKRKMKRHFIEIEPNE
jgi:hypothetical protein